MRASSYSTYNQSLSILLAPAKVYFYIQCNYNREYNTFSIVYIYIYILKIDATYIMYYACLNTIKYYTVQVTNLYTDASIYINIFLLAIVHV